MHPEIEPTRAELEPLAGSLASTFIRRWDMHARQTDDGGYICIHKPLHIYHIMDHLRGKITLGTYLLDSSNRTSFIVLDADVEEQMERLVSLSVNLADIGIPSYLEDSRRGGHLWLFFSHPIPGKDARRFGHWLIDRNGLAGVELFPKQDRIKSGPGSLIRLPFGVHRKSGRTYGFLTPHLEPLAASLAEQLLILSAPETVPDGMIQITTAEPSPPVVKPSSAAAHESTSPLSNQIKECIPAMDFIGRYVELNPAGRGSCPFHDDQHASFAVNKEENYWCCFAGCGGGSIIDFWMKYRDCDFRTAVRELADRLL